MTTCEGRVALKYLPAVTQESLLPPAGRAEANSAVTKGGGTVSFLANGGLPPIPVPS